MFGIAEVVGVDVEHIVDGTDVGDEPGFELLDADGDDALDARVEVGDGLVEACFSVGFAVAVDEDDRQVGGPFGLQPGEKEFQGTLIEEVAAAGTPPSPPDSQALPSELR